jgi:hypothetical protein
MRLFIDSVASIGHKGGVPCCLYWARTSPCQLFKVGSWTVRGSLVVGEVTNEGIEVVSGEIWVTIGVELFQGLLGSPAGSHLVVWVT